MRKGTFSSSQVYRLMANGRAKDSIGAPFHSYVEEVIMEVELQRPLQKEQNGKPTSWGTFVESRVFDLLPLDYIYQSEQRYQHETLTQWTGAPDMLTKTKVCDIKCPYSIKEYVRKPCPYFT